MAEMPRHHTNEGTPLVMTNAHAAGVNTTVKAFMNEPQISDAIFRFVNQHVMFNNPPAAYANCRLQITETVNTQAVIHAYVASYVIKQA